MTGVIKCTRPGIIAGLAAAGLTGFLVVRFFLLINQYSVNVPYWDNWNFYFKLRNPPGLWSLFTFQFGPHRLGIGFVLSRYLSVATGWNMRAECFVLGGFIVAATAAALILKIRLFGALAWHDVVIPLFMLTPGQWEIWAGVPNTSSVAIPLLLVMLYCLAWTVQRAWLRYPLLLIINFLGVFTGYCVFLGIVSIGLFALHLWVTWSFRQRQGVLINAISLVIAVVSLSMFFVGYRFAPSAPVQFLGWRSYLYVHAMALAFARACGLVGTSGFPALFGWGMLILSVFVLCRNIRPARFPKGTSGAASITIVTLIGFTLLFLSNMAVGRISLGLDAAQASRYLPAEMPCLIALYFACLNIRPPAWQRVAIGGIMALSLFDGLGVKSFDHHQMRELANGKRRWIEAYLQQGDVMLADKASGFLVWPWPERTRFQDKVKYLQTNHLSFFRDLPAEKAIKHAPPANQ